MNALTEYTPITVNEEQKVLIKKTLAPDATDAELELFCYECIRRGVHPLDRLIHFTKRKGRYVSITSIDFMRMKADETQKYAGNEEPIYEMQTSGYLPERATVHVYKLVDGTRCMFSGTARWSEYYPGEGPEGFMWRKMPYLMLGKCAESLALRKAFPAQLHGLYTPEEMNQSEKKETEEVFRFPQKFPHVGKTPDDLTTEELCTEQSRYQLLADDPTNKYREANRKGLDAIKAALDKRHPIHAAPLGEPRSPDLGPANHKGNGKFYQWVMDQLSALKPNQSAIAIGIMNQHINDEKLSLDQKTALRDYFRERWGKKEPKDSLGE